MCQLGQPFDRKAVRKAVQRFGDAASAAGPRLPHSHPTALALTSNAAFAGDAAAAVEQLCRVEARDAATLSRVVKGRLVLEL
jgi:hypothetical protein